MNEYEVFEETPIPAYAREINVGDQERAFSAVSGGLLVLLGITRGKLPGVLLALIGGELLRRGLSGHCFVYHAVGLNTAIDLTRRHQPIGSPVSVPHERGFRVDASLIIHRSPAELYRFWRNFENLPVFMHHLESVRVLDITRSHWVAKAPAGTKVEWDAEIINDEPNDRIGWRSLEGSDVPNAGSVQFKPAPDGHGTEVRVELKYDPPAGPVGKAVATLFGESPRQQIEADLRRFKQVMETGASTPTPGQASGRERSQ